MLPLRRRYLLFSPQRRTHAGNGEGEPIEAAHARREALPTAK